MIIMSSRKPIEGESQRKPIERQVYKADNLWDYIVTKYSEASLKDRVYFHKMLMVRLIINVKALSRSLSVTLQSFFVQMHKTPFLNMKEEFN